MQASLSTLGGTPSQLWTLLNTGAGVPEQTPQAASSPIYTYKTCTLSGSVSRLNFHPCGSERGGICCWRRTGVQFGHIYHCRVLRRWAKVRDAECFINFSQSCCKTWQTGGQTPQRKCFSFKVQVSWLENNCLTEILTGKISSVKLWRVVPHLDPKNNT